MSVSNSQPNAALEHSPFFRLVRTHALAMAGDTLVTLALAGSLFFSISPTAARGRVALSLVLTMAPFAVVAPLLGPAVDRSRRGRRFVIVAMAAARAVLCLAMARVIDGLLLFPVAFALLVASKAYSVAKSSLVPSTVDDEDALVEANAKLGIVGVLAGFVAAVPGILLLRLLDARWTLRLAFVVFAASALSALALPTGAVSRAGVADSATPALERAEDGGHRVTTAAAATALLRALVGFLTFLVAFGFRRAGAPSWQFGIVLAASMAANLAGAVLAPLARKVTSEERIIVTSLAVLGLVALLVARLDGPLWAAAVAAAVACAAAAGKLAFDAVVQRHSAESERGRSFARFETGFQLVWVVGALLPVVITTPLRQGYDVIAAAALLGAIAYALVERRTVRAVNPGAG